MSVEQPIVITSAAALAPALSRPTGEGGPASAVPGEGGGSTGGKEGRP
jgi:hypothetical protein